MSCERGRVHLARHVAALVHALAISVTSSVTRAEPTNGNGSSPSVWANSWHFGSWTSVVGLPGGQRYSGYEDVMRLTCFLLPALAAALLAQMSDAGIQAHLRSMLAPGERHLNIDPAEGEYLRDLVRKTGVRRAVEVGTSAGYSGLWTAQRNFRVTGLDRFADLRLGDALEVLPTIEGPIDFAFLDAVKQDYVKYYEVLLPKMRSGGVIAAHNVTSHPSLMTDFLERIRTERRVRTEIVNPGTEGISVSVVR